MEQGTLSFERPYRWTKLNSYGKPALGGASAVLYWEDGFGGLRLDTVDDDGWPSIWLVDGSNPDRASVVSALSPDQGAQGVWRGNVTPAQTTAVLGRAEPVHLACTAPSPV